MTPAERERFDGHLERVLAALPPGLHALLDEAPLIVDDEPAPDVLEEFGIEPGEEDTLCGLHSGMPLTERSVMDHPAFSTIHLYRRGILAEAGGWRAGAAPLEEEIRITLLHEMGHHFGLDEDDLVRLGYE